MCTYENGILILIKNNIISLTSINKIAIILHKFVYTVNDLVSIDSTFKIALIISFLRTKLQNEELLRKIKISNFYYIAIFQSFTVINM